VLGTKESAASSTPPVDCSSRTSVLEHSLLPRSTRRSSEAADLASTEQHCSDIKVDVHRKNSSASSEVTVPAAATIAGDSASDGQPDIGRNALGINSSSKRSSKVISSKIDPLFVSKY
jgi:hypothetical protein